VSRFSGAALALVAAIIASAVVSGRSWAEPAPAETKGRPAPAITRIEYEGTLQLEGHFRRPGDVHPYHSHQVYSTDGHDRARLDWTTWEESDPARITESFLIAGDRVFHRDATDKPWCVYTGVRARLGRLQVWAGLPFMLERAARSERDAKVSLRSDGGRLMSYARLQAHPRLGDVRHSVEYSYHAADRAPDPMKMTLYMRDSNWRLEQRAVSSASEAVAESLLQPPADLEPTPYSEEDEALGAVPPLKEIATGIWSADLADIDSRTLIVEFADYLAVIEVAVGSANGERIVDAIHRQWPGKPIRYVLFSHYHPSYTGGLRALIAEDATVITTPGNEAFVRRLAALPFTVLPDRLVRQPRPPKIVTFPDRYELADSTNRLVAINYGERSQHTDEFVLFWFPRQKVLFETEHGWVRTNGKPRAGRRAKGLLAWLDEQGLDVERFVQSFPMRDNEATLTRKELDALVAARTP
jgi:hypothetical protein